MKAVMYHYVRPAGPGLPYFPYLSLADFERQLDIFGRDYGFVSRRAFLDWLEGAPAPEGVLLTFDDGLRDHIDYVLPALLRRDLFGLFYLCSAPLVEGVLLDVHKVHLILGRIGGPAALAWLERNSSEILPGAELRRQTHYAAQKADPATKLIKDIFNWRLTPEVRGPALDRLLRYAFSDSPPRVSDIYLGAAEARALVDAGMGVGPHGHRHLPASQLTPPEESFEIETSSRFVDEVLSTLGWGYCYPHGMFSQTSQDILEKAGCPFALAIGDGADIEGLIRNTPRYSLPRHNCSAFPSGQVSFELPPVHSAGMTSTGKELGIA
jgi:peptidoglycan/xylan/chitin deacetylase (PgdA/CDA1 family)